MDRDFEAGGKKFKLRKLDAFKQFHIVRRVAPILGALLPAMGEISKVAKSMDSQSEDEKLEAFAKVGKPVMDGLSELSDQDSNYVLLGLLEAVEMQQDGGNWAPVAKNGALMFADMDLPIMLHAAGKAFAYNLAGFFGALPKVS